MQTIEIPDNIQEKFVGLLKIEKERLLKELTQVDELLNKLGSNNNGFDKMPSGTGTRLFSPTEHTENKGRGNVGWKYKIDEVLRESVLGAMTSKEIVDAVCSTDRSLDKRVAIKSIGSALSQYSKPEKRKYLYTVKQGLKYYELNSDYVE